MKIKSQKKINYNILHLTPFGHYVEYRGVLLRCEESDGMCRDCYFKDKDNDMCGIERPEAGYKIFSCVTNKNGKDEYRRYIYEDKD